jgi:hypothetical protein
MVPNRLRSLPGLHLRIDLRGDGGAAVPERPAHREQVADRIPHQRRRAVTQAVQCQPGSRHGVLSHELFDLRLR